MYWVVYKSTRSPCRESYAGPTWQKAGLIRQARFELALNTLVRSIELNKSEVLADRLHAKYLEVLVDIMNSVEVTLT